MIENQSCTLKVHLQPISKVCLNSDCPYSTVYCAQCEQLHRNHEFKGVTRFKKETYPEIFPNSKLEGKQEALKLMEDMFECIISDYNCQCQQIQQRLKEVREKMMQKFKLIRESFNNNDNNLGIEEKVLKYFERINFAKQNKFQSLQQVHHYRTIIQKDYNKQIKPQMISIQNIIEGFGRKSYPESVAKKGNQLFNLKVLNLHNEGQQQIGYNSENTFLQQSNQNIYPPISVLQSQSILENPEQKKNNSTMDSEVQLFRFSNEFKAEPFQISGQGSTIVLNKNVCREKPFYALTSQPFSPYNPQITFRFDTSSQHLNVAFGLTTLQRANQKSFVDNYQNNRGQYVFYNNEKGLFYQGPFNEIRNTNMKLQIYETVTIRSLPSKRDFQVEIENQGNFNFKLLQENDITLYPMVRLPNPNYTVKIV